MIPYIGGKSGLASWIISNFPRDYKERHYCEVFGGGGWVLFKKDPSNLETYNDLNIDLVNLFRVIRDKFHQFEYRAEWTLHSRTMYEDALKALKDEQKFTDVERALFYAIKRIQTFSANNSNSWGYAVRGSKLHSGKWLPFLKRMAAINARLKRVQIENLDFERCINKYDDPSTLFYLDPPYYGVEAYYNQPGVEFKTEDHKRLSELLRKIRGKFILSYYDHPEIIKLYKPYRLLKRASVKHSAGATGLHREGYTKPRSVELLIMNY